MSNRLHGERRKDFEKINFKELKIIMASINIVLYWKPKSTQNAYWQSRWWRFLKKPARNLKDSYVQQVKEQYQWNILECQLFIEVKIYWFWREPDRDNCLKLATDACTGIIRIDDIQIYKGTVLKMWKDNKSPRIEIFITKYNINEC